MYTAGCNSTAPNDIIKDLPTVTLNIPGAAAVGDFVSPWYNSPTFFGPHAKGIPHDFEMCVNTNSAKNGGSNGADKNVYPVGIKPGAIIAAPGNLTVTDDGMTFRVWTTPQLRDAVGLGYIVRWRTTNTWGETGDWGTPPAGWSTVTGETATGLPFWRVHVFSQSSAGAVGNPPSQDVQAGTTNTHYFNSLQDWYGYIAPLDNRYIRIFYAVEVEVRWVVIAKVSDELNGFQVTPGTSAALVRIQSRPNAQTIRTHTLRQLVRAILRPHGTCTTPSVTVPFNTLFASDLPTVGATTGTKEFTLNLTKCPRVSIRYFFRAPAGIAVDNANGVIGLDSTPGNAQGVGIQLRHNGGAMGTDPIQFNQDGNTTVYNRSRDMGQDTPQGINHSIPLRASVYRTSAAPIVPGKINASVLVYLQYP